mgnify:CR=1 FL=1
MFKVSLKIIDVVKAAFAFYPLLLFAQNVHAQKTVSAGVELDVLPYLTGGYFGAVWVGKGHVRARALYAKVNMPDFIVKDGFTNNTIRSFAIVGDYFLKEEQIGLWFGGGMVLWDGEIQSDLQLETASYQNFLLNGSIGYVWNLGNKFYLSPWAGLSVRVGGDKTVAVDDDIFEPRLLNPEMSLKLGYRF